jgi:hypothetical protein
VDEQYVLVYRCICELERLNNANRKKYGSIILQSIVYSIYILLLHEDGKIAVQCLCCIRYVRLIINEGVCRVSLDKFGGRVRNCVKYQAILDGV